MNLRRMSDLGRNHRRRSPLHPQVLVIAMSISESPRTPEAPTVTEVEAEAKAIWRRRWSERPHHYETREVLDGAYRNRGGTMRTHVMACAADGLDLYSLCSVNSLADRGANPAGLDEAPTCVRCRRHDPRHGGTDTMLRAGRAAPDAEPGEKT